MTYAWRWLLSFYLLQYVLSMLMITKQVRRSVEVFNEILDTFCPLYEHNPASLSEPTKIQFLRAIGVAVVKVW